MFKRTIILFCFMFSCAAKAQIPEASVPDRTKTEKKEAMKEHSDELDLIDIASRLIEVKDKRHLDTAEVQPKNIRISALPAAGYTLQTGFAAIAFANAAFYLDHTKETNESSVLTSLTYSQYNQIIFPIQTNIWTSGNKYNIVTDWRFLKFPSYTYGIGGGSSLGDAYTVDYSAIRLHQKIFRKVTKDFYAGAGYSYDVFWNIKEIDPPPGQQTDYQQYGFSKTAIASGLTLNLLYDNRKNSINADKGFYANVEYRPNFTALGSDNNWQSLQVDVRDYIKMPNKSVLAFWSFDWFTIAGAPPYLMLPNTGGDPYSNTGRGYIQGRYRAKNMVYLESEYRFNLTRNGLFGAVIFANAESFAQQGYGMFDTIAPGFGGGLRIKLNKYSRTNLAVDYGVGIGGSRGFFVNLGEVF